MRSLLRLRSFVRPYRKQVALALMALTLLTALKLSIPLIIRQVIDQGLADGNIQLIITAAVILFAIGLASAVLIYWQRYLTEIIAAKVGYDLRNRLYDHIQRLPFSFHDHSQTGQLISRCIEDVSSIQQFTGSGVVELIQILLLLIGVTVLLFMSHPKLAAIALLPMIPLLFITVRFGERVGDMFYAIDQAVEKLSEAGQVIYQKAAEQAQAEQAAGAEEAAPADDDVVDAEFEEVDDDKK